MKTFISTLALAFASTIFNHQTGADSSATILAQFNSDKPSSVQENPLFRWPLPQVFGAANIKVELVVINSEGKSSTDSHELHATREFMQSVFAPHKVRLDVDIRTVTLDGDVTPSNWKMILPKSDKSLTIFIIPGVDDEQARRSWYNSNEILASQSILPYSDPVEFQVFATRHLCYMLGLLPTYFENPMLNVAAEDASNCGRAGDFVCDTPFDYEGLRYDVKKKNCKYKGELGSPDVRNLLSNTWTECADRLSDGQGNKIRYNLLVIPELNNKLQTGSTLAIPRAGENSLTKL